MDRKMLKRCLAAGVIGVGIIVVFFFNAGSKQKITERNVSGVVVPHHDIVRDARDALLEEVSKKVDHPETIILVSPNHFDAGDGDIQVSDQVWETVYGPIEPNRKLVEVLAAKIAQIEPDSFLGEHGVTALLSDIKEYFPKAKLAPILLKRGIEEEALHELVSVMKENCSDCLVIASVDFSHEQPALLADLHDVLSIRALQEMNVGAILAKLEVDSPESLAVLAIWADQHNTKRFNLFEHTNGGFIINNGDEPITTHIFGWYQTGQPSITTPSATFLITGDVMFARGIERRFGDDDFADVFAGIGDRFFWGTDASVVNLEGAISRRDVPIYDDPEHGYTFVFRPVVARILEDIGVTLASLANNHSHNAGLGGYGDTQVFLEEAGIEWFGGYSSEHVSSFGHFLGKDIEVAVIGVHALVPFPDITSHIRSLKDQGSRVIIFPHWGREYAQTHNSEQEAMAHDWIDAGADLVVGSHPHVVQDVGAYRGKPIIYSLGNFLFDQNQSAETQQGMALAGMFKEDGLLLFGLPTESRSFVPYLVTGADKDIRLGEFYSGWETYATSTPVGDVYFFPH